jgi:putative transposase
VIYNSTLALKKALYDRDQSTISDTELNKRVVTENPNNWIKEIAQIPLQQSLRALITAYRSFFRKQNRFPKFKKKQSYQAVKFTRNEFKLEENFFVSL